MYEEGVSDMTTLQCVFLFYCLFFHIFASLGGQSYPPATPPPPPTSILHLLQLPIPSPTHPFLPPPPLLPSLLWGGGGVHSIEQSCRQSFPSDKASRLAPDRSLSVSTSLFFYPSIYQSLTLSASVHVLPNAQLHPHYLLITLDTTATGHAI